MFPLLPYNQIWDISLTWKCLTGNYVSWTRTNSPLAPGITMGYVFPDSERSDLSFAFCTWYFLCILAILAEIGSLSSSAKTWAWVIEVRAKQAQSPLDINLAHCWVRGNFKNTWKALFFSLLVNSCSINLNRSISLSMLCCKTMQGPCTGWVYTHQIETQCQPPDEVWQIQSTCSAC